MSNDFSDLLRSGRRGAQAAEFWHRLEAGRFALQRCSVCNCFRFPPGPGCPSCGSTEAQWVEPRSEPVIAAWTVTREAAASRLPKRLAAQIPYVLLLVRFADVDGILIPARLLGGADADLAVGLAVSLTAGTAEQPQLAAELVGA